MAGDSTDGYSGIPRVAMKRANEILDKKGCTWDTVLNAFLDKDLTEDDALRNARLARILTKELYIDGEIKLWTPPFPVTELTIEQEFRLRQTLEVLKTADREDIITVFEALQHQNFILHNNIQNLISKWPTHPAITPEGTSKSGISSETRAELSPRLCH